MTEKRVTIRSRVVTAADVAADSSLNEDSYAAKVVRYIPGEVVAAYLALSGMVVAAQGIPTNIVLWVITAILFVITPFWILYAANVPGKPRPVFQAVSATLSFIIWVFALGGPFASQDWYHPVYGSILLVLATLLMPLLEKIFVRP